MSKLVSLKLVFGQKKARWGVQQNKAFDGHFEAVWEFQRAFSKLIVMEPIEVVMKNPARALAEEPPPNPELEPNTKGMLNPQAQASVCRIQDSFNGLGMFEPKSRKEMNPEI